MFKHSKLAASLGWPLAVLCGLVATTAAAGWWGLRTQHAVLSQALENRLSAETVATAQSWFLWSQAAMAAAVVLAVLVAIFAWWSIRRRVTRPVGLLREHCERIAKGDFTGRLEAAAPGELGELM